MEVKGSSSCFDVAPADLVAESDSYSVYVCTQLDTGRQCLLKIAKAAEHNGELDHEQYILQELSRKAGELEAEYAKIKTDPDTWLNYNLGFPELVDSFICAEQCGRRINVMAFRKIDDARKVVPLDNLTSKDRCRVDLQTSGWIMGKLLKLLTFAHSEGFTVGRMDGKNVMIEPNQHYVIIFDWSSAILVDPGTISAAEKRNEIVSAARTVLIALGCDFETSAVPDVNEKNKAYVDHLLWLANGDSTNASAAHSRHYETTDPIWGHEFHPFTTLPLDR